MIRLKKAKFALNLWPNPFKVHGEDGLFEKRSNFYKQKNSDILKVT